MSVNTLSRYGTLLILSAGLWASPALAQTGLPAAQCGRAATPSEGALCANPQLRALDAELAEAYHHALAATAKGSTGRQELIAEQRQWLAMRDACKADAGCLAAAYRERLAQLHPGAVLELSPLALPQFLAKHPDAVIQLTSQSPGCTYCTDQDRRTFAEVVAHLPAHVAIARIEWTPWYLFPKETASLTGSMPGIPMIAILRDGKVVDRISGAQIDPASLSQTMASVFRE
ncbi:MAG: lysozyme inhibitor LprI family protein [Acidithiobacillus sp.]|uniref:lysozyme inhibitor LprI family protein n=1 Tax=Acidithiobacillus sp. TaxID=1872118 RepID=UPI003D08DCA5